MMLKRIQTRLADFLTLTACVAVFSVSAAIAQEGTPSEEPPQLLDHAVTNDCEHCAEGAEGQVAEGENWDGTSYSFSDSGGCQPWAYGNPALFHNFYAPNNCGGTPAQLYIAPIPVPAHVGHTYYTYQPLMPHEMTYAHHRTYRRYYDGGRGLNRTKVEWSCNPLTVALKGIAHAIEIPR